jgi:hypothetical protein
MCPEKDDELEFSTGNLAALGCLATLVNSTAALLPVVFRQRAVALRFGLIPALKPQLFRHGSREVRAQLARCASGKGLHAFLNVVGALVHMATT